jgi:CDP-diacylglycerol--glycerol-3-phosphate 3-phosphatidyltransferase
MTDAEFARAFEGGTIPNSAFHHVDHLRLAWAYLAESPSIAEAADRMRAALLRFATSVGHAEKYSDTLTIAWMRRVAAARASTGAATFEALLRRCPQLLDKDSLPDAASPRAVGSPGHAPDRSVPGQPR